MIIRQPAVAGSFYNLDPEMLKRQISVAFKKSLVEKIGMERGFVAAVVPHAGYEYSGAVAAHVYSRIERGNYIILGPNHTGIGADFALMKEGLWKTPLGEAVIDRDVAEKILGKCRIVEYDILAHQNEHSIETQLPFLQHRFGSDFKFVPICIRNEFPTEDFLEQCSVAGRGLAEVVKSEKNKWIIIASSDFSHFIPHNDATETDNYIIDSILKLDENGFFEKIVEKNASVCGFGPIATAMIDAKRLGAKRGKLFGYATSGDVTGETESVVGYAAVGIY